MLRDIAVYRVTKENMAAVWATSIHLMRLPPRANKAAIHWKKRMTTIPIMVD